MLNSNRPKRESRAVARAIIFTDIVGSTKYFATHGDQAGLAMLRRHNRALFPLIEQADGRVIKTIGDSIFAVFDHPADALTAAFALPKRLEETQATMPAEERIHIRVGVHYGLVQEMNNDIFGDAVNLAERVKSTAGADQVFASRILRDMVRGDLRFDLQSVGAHTMKGAAEPMDLFELTAAPEPDGGALWQVLGRGALRQKTLIASAGAIVLLAIAGGLLLGPMRTMPPEVGSVAVLPFRNLASDSQIDYLSLALTEELNAQLRAAGSVLVRPTSSVERYKGKSIEAVRVGEELEVGTVVEGSFLKSGEQLRVNVAIVDVRENRQIWSKPIQGLMTNMLGLFDQVARQVTSELRLRLALSQPSAQYGTAAPKAYERYLHGLGLMHEVTEANNVDAVRFLEDAVAIDPDFARAHAALSTAYATRFFWNFSNDLVWLDRAEQSARRALALNDGLAEAHYALAFALEGKGQRAETIRESLKSYRLDRQYVPALTNIARYSFYMGDFDRAIAALDRIGSIDPMQNIHIRKAIYLFFAERPEASHAENELAEIKAIGVNELTFTAITYAWLKDLDSAERMLGKLVEIAPAAPSIFEVRAWIETARGNFPEARREMAHFANPARWGIAQEMAALYSLQGDRKNAVEWLEKAAAAGAPSYAWFRSNHFKILHGDPRYEAVIQGLARQYEPVRAELAVL